jgi:hypothetical protein
MQIIHALLSLVVKKRKTIRKTQNGNRTGIKVESNLG